MIKEGLKGDCRKGLRVRVAGGLARGQGGFKEGS